MAPKKVSKKIIKKTTTNPLYFFVLATVAVMTVVYFMILSMSSASADGAKVNITFNPSTGTYPINQEQTTSVLVKTGSSTQKISGIDLIFKTGGTAVLRDIGAPVAVGGGTMQIKQVVKSISSVEARISYIFLDPVAALPQGVTLPVKFTRTSAGNAKIIFDSARSTVVGTIPNNLYLWGKLGSGSYTFK